VIASAEVSVGVPQLSLAVGVVHTIASSHSIVVGAGNVEITGGVISLVHVTVLETVAVLPQPSLAVNVLV
jgi:hypothetical protein